MSDRKNTVKAYNKEDMCEEVKHYLETEHNVHWIKDEAVCRIVHFVYHGGIWDEDYARICYEICRIPAWPTISLERQLAWTSLKPLMMLSLSAVRTYTGRQICSVERRRKCRMLLS